MVSAAESATCDVRLLGVVIPNSTEGVTFRDGIQVAVKDDAAYAVVANEVFASSSVPVVAAKWTPDDVASAAETAK